MHTDPKTASPMELQEVKGIPKMKNLYSEVNYFAPF